MNKINFIVGGLVGVLAYSMPVAAQNVDIDAVTNLAAQKAKSGNLEQSRQYLGLAQRRVWAQTPLNFGALMLIDGEAAGYKDYTSRASNQVSSGETVRIYAEPIGYAFDKSGKDFSIELSTDIKIKSSDGVVLAEANDFAQVEFTRKYRAMDIMMQLAFVVPELKAGDYVIEFTLKDQNSDEKVTDDIAIAVSE